MKTYEFYVKATDYFYHKGNYKLFNRFYHLVKDMQKGGF